MQHMLRMTADAERSLNQPNRQIKRPKACELAVQCSIRRTRAIHGLLDTDLELKDRLTYHPAHCSSTTSRLCEPRLRSIYSECSAACCDCNREDVDSSNCRKQGAKVAQRIRGGKLQYELSSPFWPSQKATTLESQQGHAWDISTTGRTMP